jgi:putative restriction endonuclease
MAMNAISSSDVPLAALATPQQRHWWVNHQHSDRAEVDGSYLWLPKKNKNGSRTQSQQNMTRLGPGDIVFSCAAGTIAAIGFALDRARSAPIPAPSDATAPSAPTDDGWLVPIRFVALAKPLRPKDHMAEIKPLLPHRQSPLRPSGEANQNVHLAELPAPMAGLLRRLLNRQVEDCETRIGMELEGKLAEKAIEERLWQRSDMAPRERQQLISARVGQGIFRERVEQTETACRVTGILDRRYLRATHIKPWKDADDREKLDGSNGLLLSPHMLHLFDRGHISFADDGALLISRHLNPYVRTAWGLERPVAPHAFTPQQRVYLHYHRQQVFEKIGGGRRSVTDLGHEQDAAG